jgi:TrpR family transcriptional regulator, trp operon repressor
MKLRFNNTYWLFCSTLGRSIGRQNGLYTVAMQVPKKHYQELCELFASVKSTKEADLLLRDILTPQEIESLAERWQLIQLLAKGMSQRDIVKKLNVSISKVTRGSHVLQYGKGGFHLFLQRMPSR